MIRSLSKHTALFCLAIVTLLPLWAMVVTSFSNKPLDIENMPLWLGWQEWTAGNYWKVWLEGNFDRYFFNSLLISVSITLANVLFDAMVAYALARKKFFLKRVVYGAIALKLMIPAVVLMVPTFLLIKKLGLYDSYLSLILPLITETFGIYVLYQAIQALPRDFENSARLEGIGEFRIFFSIVFPLLRPTLAVIAIHSFLNSWNMYLYPLILTSKDSVRTLPLGINFYLASHPEASLAEIMATAVITAFPIFLLFLVLQKKMIQSLTQGALKE